MYLDWSLYIYSKFSRGEKNDTKLTVLFLHKFDTITKNIYGWLGGVRGISPDLPGHDFNADQYCRFLVVKIYMRCFTCHFAVPSGDVYT